MSATEQGLHIANRGETPLPPVAATPPSPSVRQIYDGSDGKATKALYARLEALGPVGVIALNLFRAQKCSARAKVYRGRGYKQDAYSRKNWSLFNLCEALVNHAHHHDIRWGWKRDPQAEGPHCWVLYIELPAWATFSPTGEKAGMRGRSDMVRCQVSFHSAERQAGPEYHGDWDQSHASAQRIVNWCEDLLGEPQSQFVPAAPSVGRASPRAASPQATQSRLL